MSLLVCESEATSVLFCLVLLLFYFCLVLFCSVLGSAIVGHSEKALLPSWTGETISNIDSRELGLILFPISVWEDSLTEFQLLTLYSRCTVQ